LNTTLSDNTVSCITNHLTKFSVVSDDIEPIDYSKSLFFNQNEKRAWIIISAILIIYLLANAVSFAFFMTSPSNLKSNQD
jgi:hypothetical protein